MIANINLPRILRVGAGASRELAATLRELGLSRPLLVTDAELRDLPMVGVAKGVDRDAGKEEFYRSGKRPFALRHNDPVLYFVQRLRDEFSIYTVNSARVNIASFNDGNIDYFVEALKVVLEE